MTAAAALLSFVVGFVALSYELIWYRAYAFVSWSSPGTFGLLLGFYLLGIVVGSLACYRFCKRHAATESSRQLELLLGFFALSNLLSFAVVPLLARVVSHVHWLPTLLLVTLATSASGAVLPLLAHFAVRPGDASGRGVARIYTANIVGAALGSLVTGLVLFEYVSLRGVAVGLTIVGSLAVLAFAYAQLARVPRSLLAVAVLALIVPAALAPWAFDHLYERLLWKRRYDGTQHFVSTIENRHGVINETRDHKVYGGGVYDGGFNLTLQNDFNGVFRAYAIAGLHPSPRHVLLVGLATGSWAKAIAALPSVEKLTVIEINPGYLELIDAHREVADLRTNPKVEIVIDDGRRWLRRHPDQRFDAIIMNTTWHFRSLVSQLLSTEFLALAQSGLSDGGVLYYNTTGSPEAQRTAASAAPNMLLIDNMAVVSQRAVTFDRERFLAEVVPLTIDGARVLDDQSLWGRAYLAALANKHVTSREQILHDTAGATLVTDDNMACEWNPVAHREVTPQAFFDDD